MFRLFFLRAALACSLAGTLASSAQAQFARFVDPFLGASGGGNVFPGPVVPFGMIKPGPDMINGADQDANAGWNDKGEIRGFSQTHVSGTGGGPKYGNILIMPTTGDVAPVTLVKPATSVGEMTCTSEAATDCDSPHFSLASRQ